MQSDLFLKSALHEGGKIVKCFNPSPNSHFLCRTRKFIFTDRGPLSSHEWVIKCFKLISIQLAIAQLLITGLAVRLSSDNYYFWNWQHCSSADSLRFCSAVMYRLPIVTVGLLFRIKPSKKPSAAWMKHSNTHLNAEMCIKRSEFGPGGWPHWRIGIMRKSYCFNTRTHSAII